MLIWICDDEEIYARNIKEYCERYFEKKGEEFELQIFSSGEEVITVLETPDILFLDIELGKLNGIEVKERIWASGNRKSFIVYITNYEKYMTDAYDVNVLGFLRKPICYEMVEKILEKANHRILYAEYIYKNDKIKLSARDVLYIEASGAYTWIYLIEKSKIMERRELAEWEKLLKCRGFCRIHHSYLINMAYVKIYSKNALELVGENIKLPIARRKYKNFDKEYKEYRLGNIWG